MDTSQIIAQLSNPELLPREAILAAREKKAELVPLFLDAIENFLAGRFDLNAQPELLFFAVHLLAEWRETSAYPTLIKLLRIPVAEEALGEDVPNATSHRVIASVFDGNPAPLYEAILDTEVDEYIRSCMCEALAIVVRAGKLARDDAAAFLQQSYSSFAEEEIDEDCGPSFVWNGWQSAIAILGLEELVPLVKQAFEKGFIDPTWMGYEHFERDLNRTLSGQPPDSAPGEYTTWDNCIEEFSDWYRFSEEAARERQDERDAELWSVDNQPWLENELSSQMPASNPFRHVGRNDPCPCGSGLKFKKCCLPKAA